MIPEKLGKYNIHAELGRGAMGVVYLGFDPVIQRKVAVKTMNPEAFQDEEQRARFFREARSAGALQHPGIVTIYEMGMDGDTPYIAMEYVEGEDLVSAIQRGDLPLERKLEIMIQMLQALDYAHSKSIIHRDIKPANIRILPDGTVKIMDFGIAKQQDADFTRTGLVVGTLSYMSPEQVQGKPLDPRSDQFSAGVVFFQLLTGKKPFSGDNITNVVYQIISFKPESLEIPGAPTVLTQVVQKMMAPDPENRFASCGEAARVLMQELRYLQGEPEPSTTQLEDRHVAPPETGHLPPLPVPNVQPASRGRHKVILVVTSLLVVGVTVLGIVVGFRMFRTWKQPGTARTERSQQEEPAASQIPESAVGTRDRADLMKETDKDSVTGTDVPPTPTAKLPEQSQSPVAKRIAPSPVAGDTGQARAVQMSGQPGSMPTMEPELRETGSMNKTGFERKITGQGQATRKSKRPDIPPPGRRTKMPRKVFVKEGSVRRPVGLIGNLGPSPEEIEKFRHRIQRMPISTRKNMAKRELGAGQSALGLGQKHNAVVHFWRSVELAPRDPYGYAWLFATLVDLKAWDQADRVLARAKRQGVSESELLKNVRFRQAYGTYSAR